MFFRRRVVETRRDGWRWLLAPLLVSASVLLSGCGLGGPPDYSGAGTGSVNVEVSNGQTIAQIGNTLKAADVVKSVDAWVKACKDSPASSRIGPGVYNMRLQMSADAAVARMLDPAARAGGSLLIREGLRASAVYEAASKATGLPVGDFEAAGKSGKIGLPGYAGNNPEGFLFPATYELHPKDSAVTILKTMVDKWRQVTTKVALEKGAKAVGKTPYEVMIIASLIQSEGHPDDFTKVSRVIYNRLDPQTWGETYGLLQLDATINYAKGTSDIQLSSEDLKTDNDYNTYTRKGLPPTPICNPGEAAIQAALNPADGPWLFYVTVNPDTGETKFTDDYDEFLVFKKEFQDYMASKG